MHSYLTPDKLQVKLQCEATEFLAIFYYDSALHKHGAYMHLMNEEDKENLKWLHVFK
jgi:hypothetical protein